MTSYRGYAIRGDGRIKRAAYLAASSQREAQHAATDLCDDDIDHIEVWADAKKIDDVDCHDSEGGLGDEDRSGDSGSSTSAS